MYVLVKYVTVRQLVGRPVDFSFFFVVKAIQTFSLDQIGRVFLCCPLKKYIIVFVNFSSHFDLLIVGRRLLSDGSYARSSQQVLGKKTRLPTKFSPIEELIYLSYCNFSISNSFWSSFSSSRVTCPSSCVTFDSSSSNRASFTAQTCFILALSLALSFKI